MKENLTNRAMEWQEALKNKIFPDIETVFKKAKLTEEEKKAFLKYRKYTSDWLVNARPLTVTGAGGDSLVKKTAQMLIHFSSDNVIGPKISFLKEMFDRPPYFTINENKNRGSMKIKPKSNCFYDKYFELELVCHFINNGFRIELQKSDQSKKIPEFIARNGRYCVSIEAKNLDSDKILDKVFGYPFKEIPKEKMDINHNIPDLDGKEGNKILHQFKRSYENAMSKYYDIEQSTKYLIYIKTNWPLELSGNPLNTFIQSLPSVWVEHKLNLLLGLFLLDSSAIHVIKNPILIDDAIWQKIDPKGLIENNI